MNTIAIVLHVLASTLWVGGVFFAYIVLRPAVGSMEPARRLLLWQGVFKRFFPWVWVSIVILLGTGYWMVFMRFGGFASSPAYVHYMQMLGLLMSGLFAYLYVRLYALFKKTVLAEDWPQAGKILNRIRHIVLINLVLGGLLLAGVKFMQSTT